MFGRVIPVLSFLMITPLMAEPSCGKFHYEEKILEKLVRIEFEMEQMKKESKETVTEIKQELVELKRETDEFKTDLSKYGHDQALFLEDIHDFRNNVSRSMEVQMASTMELTDIPLVAFTVRKPLDSSPATHQTIVYGTILENTGDGYDVTTGKFTAPNKGLYVFSLHVCVPSHAAFWYGIVKEDTCLVRSFIRLDAGLGYPCRSSTVFTSLDVGERVWVKCSDYGGSHKQLHISDTLWNSFAGVMIHK